MGDGLQSDFSKSRHDLRDAATDAEEWIHANRGIRSTR